MIAKKRPDLEALVLELIAKKTEISIHDVALASGLSKSDEADRKAIRRVLNSLIQSGYREVHFSSLFSLGINFVPKESLACSWWASYTRRCSGYIAAGQI